NVHSLIHLPTDVKKYGQLDNFSAFPFENFLGQLSRLVKSPKEPLVQLCNRIAEYDLLGDKKNNTQIYPTLEREHCVGPIL
ncbi:hypothetical protein EAG_00102, partial [Camponotus floridanus]